MLLELVLLVVALLGYLLWTSTRKPERFPPGPPRLPIIGSLPFMVGKADPSKKSSFLHGMLQNIERYGPVVGFWTGRQPVCVIADYDTLKEVMKLESASGRPSFEPFGDYLRPGRHTMLERDQSMLPGVIFSHGRYWAEQRKFLLRTLRQFGFGKASMEDQILHEVENLNGLLGEYVGKTASLDGMFEVSVVNGLWSITMGERLQHDDPRVKRTVHLLNSFEWESGKLNPPILTVLPQWLLRNRLGRRIVKLNLVQQVARSVIDDIINPSLEQHYAENSDAANVKDFVDAFLAEIKKCTDLESSFYKERGMASLLCTLMDIFSAGSSTTSSSLIWSVLFLLHHPDVKKKVHMEIDMVVGDSQLRLEHKNDMHYTNAVLLEIMRMTCLASFTFPHMALAEVKVNDYILPAGTNIISSLVSIMFSPKYFPDPHTFKPERFLSPDGIFQHDDHVVAFGIGKRVCPGQTLAEKEFFLFFVGMMQKFDFVQPSSQKLPSYHLKDEDQVVHIRTPPYFETGIISRA